MKTYGAYLFVAIIGCTSAQAGQDAPVTQILKKKVEEINNALVKEEFGKVADLTHPKVVELMGGRDKMVAAMASGIKQMKSSGHTFAGVKVEAPSEPVSAGSDLFAVVPFLMEIKIPGGKLTQRSFVIGVSGDAGKSWTFVNGDIDAKTIRRVLPNLPEKLKLPEKQKPVFEKE
jgi:hypothetical protein